MSESDRDGLFNIEAFLRSRGDHASLLAIDELVLRPGLTEAQRGELIEMTIHNAIARAKQNVE